MARQGNTEENRTTFIECCLRPRNSLGGSLKREGCPRRKDGARKEVLINKMEIRVDVNSRMQIGLAFKDHDHGSGYS